MNGASSVAGRSSGSLAYAVIAKPEHRVRVYTSQGTVIKEGGVDLRRRYANVVVACVTASKTYKTGVAFDIKA